jgi:hypothetical protein
MPTRELVLITKPGCHLCDVALEMLRPLGDELGFRVREAGTDSAEAARVTAGGRPLPWVPVLVDGGRVIASGRIAADEVRTALGG